MSTQSKSAGFIIALIGGVVGLIAFFAMPFVSAFNFVSVTAPQLISLATESNSSSSSGQGLVILWLAPVLAGIAVLIAAFQFRSTVQASSKRAGGGWLVALGILGVVIYIGILIYANSLFYSSTSSGYNGPSLLSFLGAGVWIYLIGMVGVIIGGAMGLSTKSAPVMTAPSQPYMPYQQPQTQYPPDQPPQTQYPPYQQPQYRPDQQPWSQPPEFPPPSSPQWPPSQPR